MFGERKAGQCRTVTDTTIVYNQVSFAGGKGLLRNGRLELSFILLTLLFLFIQAFCNQTSLHGWQYITQRPETDGFWAGERDQSSHTNLITCQASNMFSGQSLSAWPWAAPRSSSTATPSTS